jgi:L-fuculose-phosphate aldolase
MTTPAPDPHDAALREQAVAAVRRLDALGLNRGTTGNLSVRASAAESGGESGAAFGGMWITPTGMDPDDLIAADLVWVGDDGAVRGAWEPSSEWPFHRAVYRQRSELQAVVHAHSVHATAVACLRRDLPAFHYMVAVAGGDTVPCAPYHLFGTEALSLAVGQAFTHRHACLMANHGLVAGGTSLKHAMKVALEVEALCEVYLKALAAGEPVVLSTAEMRAVIERFKTYGKARRAG